MDISNRIPKAAEVNQTSQTEQTSESQTTSPEAAESSGGITEVTDQIRPGNALNPYAQLFESPTLNPQALPVEGLPITQGGTIIPDKLASIEPQQNLPENLQPQSFNLPGIDTKIAPDHFGIDLPTGGLRGKTSLDSILGFGGSGGLQTKGFGQFEVGRDWSLVSDSSWGDEKNGGRQVTGHDGSGTKWTVDEHWNTDDNGNRTYSCGIQKNYPDGSSVTTNTSSGPEGYKKDETHYDAKGNVTEIDQTQPDGSLLKEEYKDGEMIGYSITRTHEDGSTTQEFYDPDHTYKGKVDTDADGTEHFYDKDNKPETTGGDTSTGDEYMDPEGGPAVTTTVDPNNFLRIQNIRRDLNIMPSNSGTVNTTPSNVDDPQPINIDPKRVYDPRFEKPLVTDGNPEFSDSVIFTGEGLTIRQGAEGGDPVNPNDPDLAPPAPPTKPPE